MSYTKDILYKIKDLNLFPEKKNDGRSTKTIKIIHAIEIYRKPNQRAERSNKMINNKIHITKWFMYIAAMKLLIGQNVNT